MKIRFVLWMLIGMLSFYACRSSPQQETYSLMLKSFDEKAWNNLYMPEDSACRYVLDSLESKHTPNFSSENEAYYQLLHIIIQDNMNLPFENDSLIELVHNWYRRHTNDYNYARSLYYLALVRFRIQPKDTLAYHYLKEVEYFYREAHLDDIVFYGRICQMMALVHSEHSDYDAFSLYNDKAAAVYKEAGEIVRYAYCLIDKAWYKIAKNDVEGAKRCLDSVFLPKKAPLSFYASYYNVISGYCLLTNNYSDAILYTNRQHELNQRFGIYEDELSYDFTLTYCYEAMNLLDSALYYAAFMEDRLQEFDPDNHVYYNLISKIYKKQGNTQMTLLYKEKAFETIHNCFNEASGKRILELEGLYNQAQNEKALLRARCFIAFYLGLFLICLMLFVFLWQQHRISRQKSLLVQQENDSLYTLNRLLSSQISVIQSFIGDVQNICAKYPENGLFDEMKKRLTSFKKSFLHAVSQLISQASTVRKYPDIVKSNLTDREKMLLILQKRGYSDKEIANMMMITSENVRVTLYQIHQKFPQKDFSAKRANVGQS